MRSKNCPWMSPTTVTGARTCTTLLSRMSSSLVFAHIASMTDSARSSFLYSRDMHSSRSTEAGRDGKQGQQEESHPRTPPHLAEGRGTGYTWKAGHGDSAPKHALRSPM